MLLSQLTAETAASAAIETLGLDPRLIDLTSYGGTGRRRSGAPLRSCARPVRGGWSTRCTASSSPSPEPSVTRVGRRGDPGATRRFR